ncbi:LRR receptor-like serine/threonine-protein kinase FLS2 [Klebsormidium nitens]|uniref:LRR receptor-like serine/threonine-protein kinase FLS2 n=1 Tax=Klebsormidium nitens TaxID=105231 RepID=A0A1Y1IK48_KLENI|nr:LRR receptor-like serine/threonine-protein kinase FLS2 [Klebsormidium nitens]|eukprot:GAQ91220.1 LRR receptor-like serine/threonine-protein kinase FLS2 [Klebsormidium nitens]
MGSTNLTGVIPACVGSISGLQELALFSNALVGGIPPELGLLRNLSLLRLRDNQLTGNLPEGLKGLSQLTTLDLKNNNLNGPLPAEVFANLRQLEELDLSNNTFTGPIPTEIGASGENLTELDLAHNSLNGVIPPGLGNLANLTHLDLSYNRLSGALPAELRGLRPSKLEAIYLSFNNLTGDVAPIGHLTGLSDITLNNNNFSGPIPTGWFNSTQLQVSNLAFNSFSGPVPLGIRNMAPPDLSAVLALFFAGAPAFVLSILEEVAGSIFIGLNSNRLSGSFPDIGRPNYTAAINVSDNNFSGTFRAGPFKKKNVTASFLELINNGPLDLIPGYNLSGLELVSLPNISGTGAPLIAPQMRALNVAGRGIPPTAKLDLRRVPATCPYVSYAQPEGGVITDITFWDACEKSFGCVVNLIGTRAKLSRATREKICLSKISVFLAGDSPGVRFSVGGPGSAFLNNSQGSVYFNDSAFVDHLDLGPGGVAYTGVGFARVQEGNLCRNEGASGVVGITYGVFAALILVSAAAWWAVRATGVLQNMGGKPTRPRLAAAFGVGAYLWGIISVFLAWADLVSDVLVVVEIWRVWSTWVVLTSILAPFVLSALCAGRVLLEDSNRWSPFKARLKWIPFYKLPEPSGPPPLGALPWWKYGLIPITLPATFAYVIVLDCLDLVDKIGGHLRFGFDVYSLHHYSQFRSQLDLVLRSVPQAVFQTALYLLGSSRATRIYIDEQILLRSILLSLLNVLVQFNFLVHECLVTRIPVWLILQRRFASRNCRATRLPDAAAGDEEANDKLSEKVGEL